MANYHVIIPAAGTGKRMGRSYNKLFIDVSGRSILEHTIAVFQADSHCESIHLAIHPRDEQSLQTLIKPYDKVKALVIGGSERQDSIARVIQSVSFSDEEVVLVHDGARPFVKHETIHEVTTAIQQYGAAIVGVQTKDTIKRVTQQFVAETLDRTTLWQVQTPQGATFGKLKAAYEHARKQQITGTDDASLLEANGQRVYMVEGDYDNIKLTTEEDLTYAEAILEKRR
ncbi:2-C-methyl-D-erythritol 4-phosphate cytidylyltransferase [Staphylococcus lutrae]|uniref:2-C-methyl-D-erythritol 4-phosphate cytidylyltransferase n=1 Tax=Staphylococcus lutrae TaxID=155085 RepID=A0AAC9WJN2_9STAP|nr:2-C-methyl-D-erythritol 4-phosphate cytidylyltransferase [Staphylococcus lutrae]ARJ51076.1 2-C-methyl-D-erythritol 4-phosphate cytidylyltransferase [Staphylococcus lutrae]PNZ38298.1 2-C-methyl-D-erythritol 4-phosphate cytidylyltransferase [Staphylococcus lutrae]